MFAAGCDKLSRYPGGAVAQLGARLDGIEEVVGSNPIGSTNFKVSLTTSYYVYIHPNKALGLSWLGERRFAHRSPPEG